MTSVKKTVVTESVSDKLALLTSNYSDPDDMIESYLDEAENAFLPDSDEEEEQIVDVRSGLSIEEEDLELDRKIKDLKNLFTNRAGAIEVISGPSEESDGSMIVTIKYRKHDPENSLESDDLNLIEEFQALYIFSRILGGVTEVKPSDCLNYDEFKLESGKKTTEEILKEYMVKEKGPVWVNLNMEKVIEKR